jgi:hypothetical protein
MDPVIVHTLVGQKQIPLALKCLSSLVRTSAEPVTFWLYDDGTLTKDDESCLADQLPVHAVTRRAEADERVAPLLKDYPFLRRYREEQFVSRKAIDMPLLGPEHIYYVDTDILWLAPHRGLFAGVLDRADGVFSRDCQNYYCLRPWHVAPFTDIKLKARICSGIYAFRKSCYDLDTLERFLERCAQIKFAQQRRWWTEQSLWAVQGPRWRCYSYDDVQLPILFPGYNYEPKRTLGIHFVGGSRHLMPNYEGGSRETEPVQDIRIFKSPTVNPVQWLVEGAGMIIRRKFAGSDTAAVHN